MARKIIAIHGIGNTKPGWSELLRLDLEIPKQDWIEFCYDDLMDRSFLNRLLVGTTRLYLKHSQHPEKETLAQSAEDHVNDVIAYFASNDTRVEIQIRLKEVLKRYPDAIILAHSLGSVVAYETLKNFDLKAHALFTLGSPLSKNLVKKFLRVPNFARPKIAYWFNVYGQFDPIGGRIDGLGCRIKDQFRIPNTHDLLGYVQSQRERILRLYQPNEKEKVS